MVIKRLNLLLHITLIFVLLHLLLIHILKAVGQFHFFWALQIWSVASCLYFVIQFFAIMLSIILFLILFIRFLIFSRVEIFDGGGVLIK